MQKLGRSLALILAAIALAMVLGCGNQPVAIVEGNKITKKDMYDRMEQQFGKQVLGDLIIRKLLNAAADKAGITVSQQEIDAEVKSFRDRFPDDASFAQALKQQGMTPQDLNDYISMNLKVTKLAEKDVKPTDSQLQDFFKTNQMKFSRPATVTLSEIVVSDKAKADDVRKQLDNPKASFQELARQYSISTYTRDRGGRRPEEPLAGVMPGAIRPAVASLSVGQISQPIKADSQWYIVKVEEKRPAEKADYSNPKIREDVRKAYLATHGKQVNDLIEELRKTASVKILDPKYSDLSTMFGQPQALPTFGPQTPGQPAPGGKGEATPPAAPAQPAAPAAQPAAPAQPAPPAAAPAPAAPAQPAPAAPR